MAGTHRKQEGPTVEIALTDEQQAIVDAVINGLTAVLENVPEMRFFDCRMATPF